MKTKLFFLAALICGISFTAQSQTCNADYTYLDSGLTVQFSDMSTGAPISYNWSFGDGMGFSTLQNPIYTYTAGGTYQVCLYITDGFACNSTFCDSVTVTGGGGGNCIANFTFTVDSIDPLTVHFTDSSIDAVDWSWDFGDFSGSTQQSPSHTFLWDGFFEVCLTIKDSSGLCTNTYCEWISVTGSGSNCVANFWYTTDTADPLTINFTDFSMNATDWYWDFGDGNQSTLQNPSHTFSAVDTYTVCLMISDSVAACSDTICQLVSAGNSGNCQAMFASMPDTGNPMIIYFTDYSWGSPTEWLWNFGDSTSSTLQNPSHTYSAPGTYDVCLTISDSASGCFNISCQPVVVEVCYAGYIYSVNNLTATFTDQSMGNITSWFWDFGDSTTSTQQNPDHTFPAAGNYYVCLTVSDGGSCNNTYCNWVYVTGQPMCEAGFTYTIYELFGALFADFNDTSTGNATSWYWDFGDGQFSTSQNPLPHQYDSAGMYTVCLTITDSATFCFDTQCESIYVGICNDPCISSFTQSDSGNVIYFINQSSGGCATNQWDFGDGSFPDFSANPSHTYTAVDTYLVCLTVSDPFGPCPSDSVCSVIIIDSITTSECPDTCKAGFSLAVSGTSASFTNLSTGGCATNQWDFGDGSFPDFTANPTHTYDSAGMYMVCLTVSDIFGPCPSDSSCQMVNIPPSTGTCNASFGYFGSGTTVSFYDVSTGNPVSWHWDFGVPIMGSDTSNVQNPTFNFPYSGTFNVCLSITDGAGCYDTYCTSVEAMGCNADYSVTGISDGTVTFANNSSFTNTPAYNWDFGDGNNSQSDSAYVLHTYDSSGTYNVCLTVTDALAGCVETICDSVTVVVIGINELQVTGYGLQVYPNPNNGKFTVKVMNSEFRIQNSELRVLNILGQEIFKTRIQKSRPEIDASLPSGIYFLEVKDDKISEKARFVVE